jgi:hypothetical protein
VLVDFALFQDDTLLQRGAVRVTAELQCTHLEKFHVAHQLVGDAAEIVLSNFAQGIDLNTCKLSMPVHQSDDWETIGLAAYTFAFSCAADA